MMISKLDAGWAALDEELLHLDIGLNPSDRSIEFWGEDKLKDLDYWLEDYLKRFKSDPETERQQR